MKKGAGHCCYLSFAKAEELFEELNNKKKLVKYRDRKSIKSKFNISNFIYLKKLGEGQFGQVFLVKNIQFGTHLYAIKCLSKEYIKK